MPSNFPTFRSSLKASYETKLRVQCLMPCCCVRHPTEIAFFPIRAQPTLQESTWNVPCPNDLSALANSSYRTKCPAHVMPCLRPCEWVVYVIASHRALHTICRNVFQRRIWLDCVLLAPTFECSLLAELCPRSDSHLHQKHWAQFHSGICCFDALWPWMNYWQQVVCSPTQGQFPFLT